jgi:hypothetical protein
MRISKSKDEVAVGWTQPALVRTTYFAFGCAIGIVLAIGAAHGSLALAEVSIQAMVFLGLYAMLHVASIVWKTVFGRGPDSSSWFSRLQLRVLPDFWISLGFFCVAGFVLVQKNF